MTLEGVLRHALFILHFLALMFEMRFNDSEGHCLDTPSALWAFFGHNTS
jgi:hypothetical protein